MEIVLLVHWVERHSISYQKIEFELIWNWNEAEHAFPSSAYEEEEYGGWKLEWTASNFCGNYLTKCMFVWTWAKLKKIDIQTQTRVFSQTRPKVKKKHPSRFLTTLTVYLCKHVYITDPLRDLQGQKKPELMSDSNLTSSSISDKTWEPRQMMHLEELASDRTSFKDCQ